MNLRILILSLLVTKNTISHYEYLLKMGESLGSNRDLILNMEPLPETQSALEFWQDIGDNRSWIETMTAMHSLELIAYRNIVDYGAKLTYFDPKILSDGSITPESVAFLREGYEADIEHADEALDLVAKYVTDATLQPVQATFIQSIDWFDRYLMSRLERAREFE